MSTFHKFWSNVFTKMKDKRTYLLKTFFFPISCFSPFFSLCLSLSIFSNLLKIKQTRYRDYDTLWFSFSIKTYPNFISLIYLGFKVNRRRVCFSSPSQTFAVNDLETLQIFCSLLISFLELSGHFNLRNIVFRDSKYFSFS